jgi:exportin-1
LFSDECLLLLVLCFQDNKDLYAEEAAAQRERERQRMLAIPGLIAPIELQDEMVDS